MHCQDLMKTDIICCSEDESIFDCATKMNREDVGFVPVCKKDHAGGHRVIGTLTDRDIVLRVVAFPGGRDPRAVKAGEVMSKDPISCRPSDDIEEAADLMAQHRISRVCVCEGDRLEGLISLSDIVEASRERGAETLRKVGEREVRTTH